MDESRKQFEEWFCKKNKIPGSSVLACRAGDSYWDEAHCVTNGIQRQWECWQASRAAIEIKLDDKVMVEDEFDKGHNCAIDYCAEAIRAAGIKVKE